MFDFASFEGRNNIPEKYRKQTGLLAWDVGKSICQKLVYAT